MNLREELLKDKRIMFHIPSYIKSHAKTRAIAKLRKQFEDLIKDPNGSFCGSRTSEIFITLGTKKGEQELKYYPKVRSSYYSHITKIND